MNSAVDAILYRLIRLNRRPESKRGTQENRMGHEHRHRGTHPEDMLLFADSQTTKLREALQDYCWLLTHGYAPPSSLKLVGDKFQLAERQRLLLMRSACTESQRLTRQSTRRTPSSVAGCDLYLDGFNVLIALESALSGGFLFVGQDGCYRDLASVHGTYKRVQETHLAIRLIGQCLQNLRIRRACWLLDQPVSNSGRLRQLLLETAEQNTWNWQVDLCSSPDNELQHLSEIIVSTDSVILDSATSWFHLNQQVIEVQIPHAKVIDLRQRVDGCES